MSGCRAIRGRRSTSPSRRATRWWRSWARAASRRCGWPSRASSGGGWRSSSSGETLDDDERERRFLAECRAVGRLSGHPAVVTVHDAGTTADGRPYLVMEHLPGGSLHDRLRASGPLTWAEATDVGVHVADALSAAHDTGILHRDVKPANVLLDETGAPKLADFGIARLAEGTATATGHVLGTILYTPPEVLSGRRPAPTADVWALGAMLHTLLTGRSPFQGSEDEPPAASIARVLRSEPPELPGHPPARPHRPDRGHARPPSPRTGPRARPRWPVGSSGSRSPTGSRSRRPGRPATWSTPWGRAPTPPRSASRPSRPTSPTGPRPPATPDPPSAVSPTVVVPPPRQTTRARRAATPRRPPPTPAPRRSLLPPHRPAHRRRLPRRRRRRRPDGRDGGRRLHRRRRRRGLRPARRRVAGRSRRTPVGRRLRPPAHRRPPRRRGLLVAAIVAVVVLVAVAAAAVLLVGGGDDDGGEAAGTDGPGSTADGSDGGTDPQGAALVETIWGVPTPVPTGTTDGAVGRRRGPGRGRLRRVLPVRRGHRRRRGGGRLPGRRTAPSRSIA